MPGAGLPGLRGQRLPRQPHPRPGVVEAEAELIQAQVLVPFLVRSRIALPANSHQTANEQEAKNYKKYQGKEHQNNPPQNLYKPWQWR